MAGLVDDDTREDFWNTSMAGIMDGFQKAMSAVSTRSVLSRVSPKCRALFIVGDPVGVTRSPLDFPTAFKRFCKSRAAYADADAVLLPLEVDAEFLDALVTGPSPRGILSPTIVAATPRAPRGYVLEASCGDAVGAAWIV